MIFAPEVSAPTDLPLMVADIKPQISVFFDDDDSLIESYIRAAVGYLDGPTGILGRAVMPQVVVQKYEGLSRHLDITYGSVISVTSVEYADENGVLQSITDYSVLKHLSGGTFLHIKGDLPRTEAGNLAPVVVSYRAGWEAVPEQILQAIRLMVAHWYNRREASAERGDGTGEIPFGVADMVAPLRRVGI